MKDPAIEFECRGCEPPAEQLLQECLPDAVAL